MNGDVYQHSKVPLMIINLTGVLLSQCADLQRADVCHILNFADGPVASLLADS
jgi:hypothetical protein